MVEKFLGFYLTRSLRKGEVYYCQNGCGVCEKKAIREDNRKVISDGDVLECDYSIVEVSSCCGTFLGIWNDEYDIDVGLVGVDVFHELIS